MKNKIIPAFAIASIILSFLAIFKVDAIVSWQTINFWQGSDIFSSFPAIGLVICAGINLALYFLLKMDDFTILHMINPVGNIVFIFFRLFNVKNALDDALEVHIALLGWVFLIASVIVAVMYFRGMGSSSDSGSSDSSSE